MGKPEFGKGMEVEVCSDDQGLRGAWFIATILRSLPRKKQVLVEYHTLMAEDESTKPLREMVDVVNIRPVAPREIDRGFSISDEVDAAHNDGWWEGVVIRVLDDFRYLVYFRTGKEEHVFRQSELRIHREWVHGKWVPPLEEESDEQGKEAVVADPQEKIIELDLDEEVNANRLSKGGAEVLEENVQDMEEHKFEREAGKGDEMENEQDMEEAAEEKTVDMDEEVHVNTLEEEENGDTEEDSADQMQDIDVEHIEIGVRSDQAQLPLVHNTVDIANSEITIEGMEQPCPNSNNNTELQRACEELNEGEAGPDSSIIAANGQAVDAPPTREGEEDPLQKKDMHHNLTDTFSSSPEGLTDHLKTNYCQLNCDLSGSYPTTDEIGLSMTSDNEGEKFDLSDTHVQVSEKSLVVQEASDQQPCTETGSVWPEIASCGEQQCEKLQAPDQNVPTKKRRKGPERRILVEPFVPSEDPQQCRRTGKGWRCTVMAFPGKRYCEKHDIEQNTRNVKRRKRPIETRAMEQFVPSDPQQCRRTGKGWRCHIMALSGKRYCDKHQQEQDIHNEKRRKRRIESIRCEEKSNSHSDHLISSDHLQCDGVDMDTQCNQSDSGNDCEAQTLEIDNTAVSNEPNEGDAGRNDPGHDQGDIERTEWVQVMGACTAVNTKINHSASITDQEQVDDTAVSGESNICDSRKTDQAQVSQVGNTARINVANESDTRKRKMGEFYDEFWSVFIT